nr:hypothetical protein [Tanacetum cinerariifolium]
MLPILYVNFGAKKKSSSEHATSIDGEHVTMAMQVQGEGASHPCNEWVNNEINAMKATETESLPQKNSFANVVNGTNAIPHTMKNYVKNTWSKFRFEKLMSDDDGVFYFKFSSLNGLEQVTRVPVWVKLHKVSIVAYLEDGLSLIATQIKNPIMPDAFTSAMCMEAWGRIGFARALIEFGAHKELKQEVTMAIPKGEDESAVIH